MNENTNFQIRPLYLQVRDALLDRIKKRELMPGGNLPSEVDLHRELRVSLGTLRKALGVLEAERFIVRQPGRGTFVRSHQAGKTLNRFDPIRVEVLFKSRCGRVEQIARFHRVRFIGQRAFAYELVCLPDRRFPGLALRPEIPNELEELAQSWGLLVARAEAKVRTRPAPAAAAAALSLRDGAVVFSLERLAFDSDDQPIEMMTAYFDLRDEFCKLELR